MEIKNTRFLKGLPAVIFFIFGTSIIPAQTPDSGSTLVIEETSRPMERAADWLQSRFEQPVSYEDPILASSQDTQPVQYSGGNTGLLPRKRGFSVTIDPGPDKADKLETLNKVVEAYHAQADGPRFRVIRSNFGLHVVPAQVRSRNGAFKDATPMLDTVVTIPVEKRTPSEHVKVLCEAVSKAAGVTLKDFMPWLDGYYMPYGVTGRNDRSSPEEYRRKTAFEWGAANMVARDALIDFFEHSSSTLSWKLLCEPAEGYCVLNLAPIMVYRTGPDGKPQTKAIQHDRDKLLNSR
jgi:hypothetical protein